MLALRVVLGGVLIAAGALKVAHADSLAAAIAGYRLLPQGAVLPLAIALPPFEILVGLYLVAGLFRRVAAGIACAMFAAYCAAIASAVARHIPANCGCFGPGDASKADWQHALADAVAALVALAIALVPSAFSADALFARWAKGGS
ncbi:MAG: MauE/DoxX family redox-associated membrane protein [Candidatus Tyrphobacter sp.]